MRYCLSLFVILLTSCKSTAEKKGSISASYEIELPYFNDPDFNPIWIDDSDLALREFHTIANFEFQNQLGNWISQNDVKDRIYVANFFFTSCTTVCPKMSKNLMGVQNAFLNDDRVKILSFSVMPWIDTVEKLGSYAAANNIDSTIWHLLTGPKNEIYKLARESYFADEGFGKSVSDINDFIHTENFILIDQKKRIRAIYNGTLPLETKRLIEDIKSLF